MSFDAVKWVRAQAFTKPSHRYLALEIADYADEHGKAWPSVETLAKRTLLSPSTINRTLAQLEKVGILQRENRRKNGHQTSNVIRLAMTPQPVRVTPCEEGQPVTVTPRKAVQPVTMTCWQHVTMTDKPSKEEPISKKEPVRENAPSALAPHVAPLHMNGLGKESGHPMKEASKEGSKERSQGTVLPDDWAPSQADEAYGQELGLTREQIWDYAEDMRLWAGANANRAVAHKADWSATFRHWMRREANGGYRARPHEKGFAELAADIRNEHGVGRNQDALFTALATGM